MFFWHKRKIDNFDPYNVFLAIATNILQRLKTGFVVQGHIYYYILGGSSLTNYIFKYTNYVFVYIKSDQIFGIIKVSLMILKVFYANNSIYLIKKMNTVKHYYCLK